MAKKSKKTKTAQDKPEVKAAKQSKGAKSSKAPKDANTKDSKTKVSKSDAGKSKPSNAAEASTVKGAKGATKRSVSGGWSEALLAKPGTDLASIDTRSTPNWEDSKSEGKDELAALADHVSDLQERLYAEATAGGQRSVLLVIQGMDTAGKGGIMRHVIGAMDPQGVAMTAFKAPTAEEKSHPFLWRIRKALPEPGEIGVFDRSHYEDVLIVRVHDLVPRAQWARRYNQINTFERGLVEKGTTVIKVMLHLSADEQRERLAERLDREDKYWKFNPQDVDERQHWDEYREAYQAVIDRCSTDDAPWFVVPADRKWYARLAVMNLVKEHLEKLDLTWPEADFDIEEQKQRLADS